MTKRLRTEKIKSLSNTPDIVYPILPDGSSSVPCVCLERHFITKDFKTDVMLLDESFIDWISEAFKIRIRNKFDTICFFSGLRRRGKSILALQIAMAIDKSFTADRVCFTMDDFTNLYERMPRANPAIGFYPVIIMDEIGFAASKKTWAERIQINLNRSFQVSGEKGLIVLLVAPKKNYVDSDTTDMSEIWINVWDRNLKRGQADYSVADPSKATKVFWKDQYEFLFDDIDEKNPLYQAYLAKKRSFIDDSFNLLKKDTEKHDKRKSSNRFDATFAAIYDDLIERTGERPYQLCKRLKIDPSTVSRKTTNRPLEEENK